MDEKEKQTHLGPIIVSLANAMRAFDAPVRNPMLLSVLPSDFFWNPAQKNLTNALRLSGFSSFVVTIEHLIGALILTPILMLLRGYKHFLNLLKSFKKRELFSVGFISLGSGLGLFFFLISFALGNPTVAILLQKSQPLITLLVAMLILGERPTKFYYISAIIALIGIFFMSFEDLIAGDFFNLMAALSSLVAALFWGSNTVFGRILTDKADYWDITVFRYIGGSIILIIFNLILFTFIPENINALTQTFTTFPQLFPLEMIGIIAILYSALFTGGIIPLVLYYFGLRWSKASIGGLAELSFPLLAIFVNFVTLGYGLSVWQIFGAIILFSSVMTLSYVNAREYKRNSNKNL